MSTQEAMEVCPYDTASHFLGRCGACDCKFCLKFEHFIWQKRYCVDHDRIELATGGFSNHSYMSKEDYWTPKKQWMSILMTHHHISQADVVPEIA